ncbi:snRNA-activating protein complex subunit [Anaeramoeba flamelloides]|uniref:snRNA-activating protein complex subunit n=1 Tax=Anaeramoeba flamelloides TaxID=1746091 RepID=A0AAV7Z9F2_9EUKA|nr:snRNA-activating protein complex subunit [Anaeramoeba flamelloides]
MNGKIKLIEPERRRSTNEGLKNLDFSQVFERELKKEEKEMNLWTQKDDELLKDLVKEDHKTNWELVSQKFENFDSTMCLKRYRKILNIETKKGMWTDIEDNLLVNAIKLFGDSNWSQVSVFVYGRNSKQCRERWNNQLNPDINRSQFTVEEEELLIQKQKELGNKWTTIAQFFENRPDNMIKNAWHSLRVRKGLPNYFSPKKKNNKRRKNARKKKKILIGKQKTKTNNNNGKGSGGRKQKENEREMDMDMEIIQEIENDNSNFNFKYNKNNQENENENEKEKEKEFQNEQIVNRNLNNNNNKGSQFNNGNNHNNNKRRLNMPNLKIEIKNNSKTIPKRINSQKKKKKPDIKVNKVTFFNKNNKIKTHDSFNSNQIIDSENEFYSPQSPREHINSPKLNPLQDVSFKIRKLNLSTQNLTTKSAKMKYPLSARSPRIKNYPLSPRSRNYQLSPRLSKKSPKFKRKNTKEKRKKKKTKKKKRKKKKIAISPRRNRLVSEQFQKNNLNNGNENRNIIDRIFAKEPPNKDEFKMISPINEKTKNNIFNNISDFNNSTLDNNTLSNNTLDDNSLGDNTLDNNDLDNNNLDSINQNHKPHKNGNINQNKNEKPKLSIFNLNEIPKENIIEKKQIFNINNNIKNMIQENNFSYNNHNISHLINQASGGINLFNNSTFMDKVINDDKKKLSDNNNKNNYNFFEQTNTDFITPNQSINSNTEVNDYLLLSPQDLKINTFFDNTVDYEFNKNTYSQQDYLFGDSQFSNYTFLNGFEESNNWDNKNI